MNIAVGTITQAAREVIAGVGGTIEPTKLPDVLMVSLPDDTKTTACRRGMDLTLSNGAVIRFVRAWHTEDCRLEIID